MFWRRCNEIDDVFLSSSALMFELNNKLMVEHGIKTPRLYYMDEGFEEPVYALVEYIDGVDLDYVLEKQPERANVILKSLKRNLDALHEIKSSKVGQLNNFLEEDFDPIEYCYCMLIIYGLNRGMCYVRYFNCSDISYNIFDNYEAC